jgi:DNA repair protein RadC
MTDDVAIRAARAQQLLEDEVLNEAMEALHEDAIEIVLRADLASAERCVAAVSYLQATNALIDKLRSFVTAGKAAERKPYKVA